REHRSAQGQAAAEEPGGLLPRPGREALRRPVGAGRRAGQLRRGSMAASVPDASTMNAGRKGSKKREFVRNTELATMSTAIITSTTPATADVRSVEFSPAIPAGTASA